LKFYNLNLSDIDNFAIHPGGPKILQRIEDSLNIPPEQNEIARNILKNYGNMSSVTILFILKNLLSSIAENKKSNKILGMAFGPGLTIESFLLKVSV
jgi:alpha-pyrone synthase